MTDYQAHTHHEAGPLERRTRVMTINVKSGPAAEKPAPAVEPASELSREARALVTVAPLPHTPE